MKIYAVILSILAIAQAEEEFFKRCLNYDALTEENTLDVEKCNLGEPIFEQQTNMEVHFEDHMIKFNKCSFVENYVDVTENVTLKNWVCDYSQEESKVCSNIISPGKFETVKTNDVKLCPKETVEKCEFLQLTTHKEKCVSDTLLDCEGSDDTCTVRHETVCDDAGTEEFSLLQCTMVENKLCKDYPETILAPLIEEDCKMEKFDNVQNNCRYEKSKHSVTWPKFVADEDCKETKHTYLTSYNKLVAVTNPDPVVGEECTVEQVKSSGVRQVNEHCFKEQIGKEQLQKDICQKHN